MNTTYTVLWLLWLLGFVVIEGAALRDKRRGDTLSEHVWTWFCMRGTGRFAKLRRVALISFLIWLLVHFVGGGRLV
jgi:hypothetical protein